MNEHADFRGQGPDRAAEPATRGSEPVSEIVARDRLVQLRPAWSELSCRAVEENPYYAPDFALALLDTVERLRNVHAVLVWDGAHLAGFLPFVQRRHWPWGPFRLAHFGWVTPYSFMGAPLLDRACTDAAADALVDRLCEEGHQMWTLSRVNTAGESTRALIRALERRKLPHDFTGRFSRAAIDRGASFDDHMKQHVASKRRRELARNRRRLAALGRLEYQTHAGGAGLEAAVEAFLELEARGWKGRRGSALALKPETLAFARRAFSPSARCPVARADVLSLDGKPIAVGLTVQAGRTGFTIKNAYDEAYRNYSAGLLLEEDVVRDFLEGDWAERLDSSTSGKHVIEALWPGRIEIADLVFCADPQVGQATFQGLVRREQLRRKLRAAARQAIDGVRTTVHRLRHKWSAGPGSAVTALVLAGI
jgi:CelD/BcsL family acetyltransferase involved in cellulose biosynthesis